MQRRVLLVLRALVWGLGAAWDVGPGERDGVKLTSFTNVFTRSVCTRWPAILGCLYLVYPSLR